MKTVPTLTLWSINKGKQVAFTVTIEGGDYIATHEDEFVRFPGTANIDELLTLAEAYNEVNDGVVARSEDEIKSEAQLSKQQRQTLKELRK